MNFEQRCAGGVASANPDAEQLQEQKREKALTEAGQKIARIIMKAGNRIIPDVLTAIDGKEYNGKAMRREGISPFDAFEKKVGELPEIVSKKKGIIKEIAKKENVELSADEVLWHALQTIGRDNEGDLPGDLADVYVAGLTKRIARKAYEDTGTTMDEVIAKELDLSKENGIEIVGDMGEGIRTKSEEELIALVVQDVAHRSSDDDGDIDVMITTAYNDLGERGAWTDYESFEQNVKALAGKEDVMAA